MKCGNCGLVNFKTATNCKRCGASLQEAPDLVADETTVAWRDADLLVLAMEGFPPERCLQCNSSDGVKQKTITLGYYPKYNLFLLLFGFIYYKTIKLEITLCEAHLSARSQNVFVTFLFIIIGVIIFIVALANMSAMIFGIGILVFGAGGIFGVVRGSPVSISKMDKTHLWIEGVCREYLAALPKWMGR
jgi:hypothetical protein